MLRCEGLTKKYGKTTALNQFSLEFRNGIYGVLGPNGAGKTTLFRLVAGILAPTEGCVRWNDTEIHRLGGEYRAKLGVLPQRVPCYPWMKGAEYLAYMHDMKGLPAHSRKADVEATLKKVELWDDAQKKIRAYSGGMRQRLGIAQAILGSPRLMLLDEPTAGLDPRQRVIFKNIVREMAQDSIVILCTHIISDLTSLAEQILILQSGRLIEHGQPDELLARLEGKTWWIPESEDCMLKYPDATRVLLEGKAGLKILGSIGDDPLARPLEPTLEDLYQFHFKEASQ